MCKFIQVNKGAKKACIFSAVFAVTLFMMGGLLEKMSDMPSVAVTSVVPLQSSTTFKIAEGNSAGVSTKTLTDNSVVPLARKAPVPSIVYANFGRPAEENDAKTEAKKEDALAAHSKPMEAGSTLNTVYRSPGVPARLNGFVYSSAIPMSQELQAYTYYKCQQRGLDYELILAIMWRESRFTINAVGHNTNGTQDSGIMQINDCNKSWLRDQYGITDLLDPYQNIDAGTIMLGTLNSKYGEHNALLAYQFGEAGMAAQLKKGNTTNELVELVYRQREYYRQLI